MAVSESLAREFAVSPGLIEKIEEEDVSFESMTRAYGEIDKRIHRIESLVEPAEGDVLIELKRHRSIIREEIAAVVAAKRSAVA